MKGHPMRLLPILLLLSSCGALSDNLAKGGANPGEMACKGKFTLSGMGKANVGAGFVGSGDNAWSITGDCGEGAYLRQGLPTGTLGM